MILSESFNLPPTSPRIPAGESFNFTFSGDFAVGEGHYEVEFLLIDQKDRRFYRRWKLKTSGPADASPLKPLTVAASVPDNWDGKLDANGVRLTVLLDATETSPKAAGLHRGTSAYLLKVLATILRQVPCRSVKLVLSI